MAGTWFAIHLPAGNGDNGLRDRIAALETQLSAAPKPAENQALGDLGARIGKLEQAIAKLPAISTDAAMAEKLAAIENAMKALGVSLAALSRRTEESGATLTAMRERADTVAKTAEGLQAKLNMLEQSAKATQDKAAQNGAADTAARRVLTAFALRDAVMRAAPYASELAAKKSLGAQGRILAALEPFAQTGVPTVATLTHELGALLPAMIAAAGADAARAGGFIERLQANAGKLVRIQPVGEPSGDNPPLCWPALRSRRRVTILPALKASWRSCRPKHVRSPRPGAGNSPRATPLLPPARKLAADSAGELGVR